ncbi:MAG: LEA type 2 family protein [bacterium]
MRIQTFLLSALVCGVTLSGCGVEEFLKKNVQKPIVRFSGVRIARPSFDSLDLLFDLEITNPNPVGIRLDEFEYNLALGGTDFLQGQQEEGMELRARSTDIVHVPLTLDYTDIYDTIRHTKDRDSTDYEIRLVLAFDLQVVGLPVKIPVRKQGRLPLIKPPKIKVSSLQLNRLGLTGADLVLRILLSNPNAFTFKLEQMSYQFAVNDVPWMNANSQKVVKIPAKDKGVMTFPISLNFLQVGRSVYDLLTNDRPVQYRFSGDLKLTTSLPILSKVTLPFDHAGEIALRR